jgi:large subunit ribosomal protein L4
MSFNKKMRRLALRSALSSKVAEKQVVLIDQLTFEAPKTKDMLAVLAVLPLEGTVYMVIPERDDNVYLSARNIPGVKVSNIASLNMYEVLKYQTLVLPVASVKKIEEVWG